MKGVDCSRVWFSGHAIKRMFERSITVDNVLSVISSGEVIADYEEDKPYPSILMLGFSEGCPIHVVLALDDIAGMCYVISTYIPDPQIWEDNFRKRLK